MRRPALAVLTAASALAALVVAGPADAGTAERAAPGSEIAILHTHGGPGAPADLLGSTSDITNHGGSVMRAPIKAYVIWYGSWGDATARGLITNYLDKVDTASSTNYWNINTAYTDATGSVSGSVSLAGEATTSAYLGTKLSDSSISRIVKDATTTGVGGTTLPVDPDGVYFVLTSKGIAETSGFLTRYCGWHTKGTFSGTTLKYSFVGDPTGTKLSNCAAQTTSPNGYPGVDAMVSVVAHELEEAATDPNLDAWYDSSGYENADKCAWTFGATQTVTVGGTTAKYNLTVNGTKYLVQQNWALGNPQVGCTMSG